MPSSPADAQCTYERPDAVKKDVIRMLSFERVLEAFREHLTEDTGVEVVPTRHGYTYLT